MTESTQIPPKFSESSSVWGTTGSVPAESKAAAVPTEQLVVTRNTATGDVVKIEVINDSGQRTEMSQETIRSIAGVDEIAEIASALDEAFDAGVSMLLEETNDEEDVTADDAEHAAIVRLLLIPLVGRRTVRRIAGAREGLLRKLFLRRLVRRYAFEHRAATTTITK
jgi:hypothetical protein